MAKQPTRDDASQQTRLLRVDIQQNWKAGDLIGLSVPQPCDYSSFKRVAAPDRVLYVELPRDVNKTLYIRYYESFDGVPILLGDDDCKTTSECLDAVPIVVPTSAVIHKEDKWFKSIWDVTWQLILPLGCYVGVLLMMWALFPEVYDRNDEENTTHNNQRFDRGVLWLYGISGIATIIGIAIIWFKFRRSVLFSEVCWHVLLAGIGFCMCFGINTGFSFMFDAMFSGISESTKLHGENLRHWLTFRLIVCPVAPIVEELEKYLVLRLVTFRSVIVDGYSLLCYGLITGLIFGLWENVWIYFDLNRHSMSDPSARYLRWMSLALHLVCAGSTAYRLASWRFLGRHQGFWRVIWPAVTLHLINNCSSWITGFGTPSIQDWEIVFYICFDVLRGILYFMFAVFIMHRTSKIPGIDIHKLMETGQFSPRGVGAILSDLFCCFSRKEKGLFSGARHEHRPILIADVESSGKRCDSEDSFERVQGKNTIENVPSTQVRFGSISSHYNETMRVARKKNDSKQKDTIAE